MMIGESGYTLPWGIVIDAKTGNVYIDKTYPIDNHKHGTMELKVKRLSLSDYEVDFDGMTTDDIHIHDEYTPDRDDILVGNIKASFQPTEELV